MHWADISHMDADHSAARQAGEDLVVAQAQRQIQTFFDELKNGTSNYRTVASLDAQGNSVGSLRARSGAHAQPHRNPRTYVTNHLDRTLATRNPSADCARVWRDDVKIRSIHLRDFKRFTSLTISELPDTAILIVLVGPNGCGKSSVFDALHGKAVVEQTWGWQPTQSEYWNKTYSIDNQQSTPLANPGQNITIEFHGSQPTDQLSWARALYARPAYRNDPVAQVSNLGRVAAATAEHRFQRMIENDAAVSLNYQRLVSSGCEQAFDIGEGTTSLTEFRHWLIGDIRDAIRYLFDNPMLDMDSLGNPLTDGTFRFSKGHSQRFSYENLSGGEKAAFDLILDLVIKRREFSDTVFCIDEPEAHLGLRLQGRLLRELYRLVPSGCQLWIATHSVGMMRAAYALEQKNPGTVVFLDFDKRDFDHPQTIAPATIDRRTWEKMHSVALEDLATLVAPDRIVLCEGKPGDRGLDAECYNAIFGEKYADTLFVSTGGKGEAAHYGAVIKAIVAAEVVRLRDRDGMTDRQVAEERKRGVRVLSRAKIENYLLDHEVLSALCESHTSEGEDKLGEVLQLKQQKLAARSGDMKAIVNDVRNWVLGSLGVRNAGDNPISFLRDTLAPLINPDMEVYTLLERDIFG